MMFDVLNVLNQQVKLNFHISIIGVSLITCYNVELNFMSKFLRI